MGVVVQGGQRKRCYSTFCKGSYLTQYCDWFGHPTTPSTSHLKRAANRDYSRTWLDCESERRLKQGAVSLVAGLRRQDTTPSKQKLPRTRKVAQPRGVWRRWPTRPTVRSSSTPPRPALRAVPSSEGLSLSTSGLEKRLGTYWNRTAGDHPLHLYPKADKRVDAPERAATHD